jgi:RNA polymerase sigma factor (sigma-70 family)
MSEAAASGGIRSGSGSVAARVLSDDRLVRRAAAGDERAFATIFRRYHQRLYRYCLAIVGDSQDAQDALQNTMVKVLRALPAEERQIALKPWLYRIAHNESIELIRRRRETRQLDPDLAAGGSGLAEEAAVRERLRGLIADLDELPERQRGALIMRELAGLEFAEVATALGTSPAVARQTVYEARLSLRQMAEGREVSCEAVTRALSDGDGRVLRRRDLRAHLRSCASCRGFRDEIESRECDLSALSPLPAVAAAGLLQGVLAGHGAGGGGLATALGGGAAKSLGASAALKGAATVAVVAALGVGAADRGGLIDLGSSPEGRSKESRAAQPGGAGSAGARPVRVSRASVGAAAGSGAASKRAGHLGAFQVAEPHAGEVTPAVRSPRDDGKTSPNAAPANPSRGSSVAHPYGKGHEKELPSAAAHGQETAAGHKTVSHGSAGTRSHPLHPSKPPRPAQPSNPGSGRGSPSPPSSAPTPETHSHGNAAGQAMGTEAVTPEPETGKKP